MITYNEYLSALNQAGLKKDATVLIHSGVSKFGKPKTKANKKDILDFYYNGIIETIGKNGTIVTPTFTGTHYVRKNLPFDIKTTKSEVGAFSEFVRTKPNSIRSIHPIASLTAIGKNATLICGNNHFDGYGYDSPWGKLLNLNSNIITLGYALYPSGMSAIHFMENMIGVPYLYNKIFRSEVYNNKQKIKGLFTMSVRYLEYNVIHDQTKFKKILVKNKKAKIIKLGNGEILSTNFNNLFETGKKTLSKDRYILLKNSPTFKSGEKPLT